MVTCGPAFSIKKMVTWFGIAQGPHSLEKTLNFRVVLEFHFSLNFCASP